MSGVSGYIRDNVVPPATASAESGIAVAKIVEAFEAPEGLIVTSTGNHLYLDPGDALPVQVIAGV